MPSVARHALIVQVESQDVHGGVLIAADVAKGDPHDAAARDDWNTAPAPPAEDLHRIPSRADQQDGPVQDEILSS